MQNTCSESIVTKTTYQDDILVPSTDLENAFIFDQYEVYFLEISIKFNSTKQ